MSDSTKTLQILGNSKKIYFSQPQNLLELLNANNISISQSCGANGTCTTCRFFIRENPTAFSTRSEIESERAEERNFLVQERLACQTEIFDSATIELG